MRAWVKIGKLSQLQKNQVNLTAANIPLKTHQRKFLRKKRIILHFNPIILTRLSDRLD